MNVIITSFSYLDGYPADTSPHGGGFILDCRLLHNPYIIAELKDRSGKEQPVIEYLDQQPDVQEFAKLTFSLVDMAIERYQKRSFDYLSIGFGCTGGKHRSVYMAERLAKHIHEKFPEVEVAVRHTKGW